MKGKVRWASRPTENDYAAARRYLSLVVGPARAAALVGALRKAKLQVYPARDLMRTSEYRLPVPDDKKQRKEITSGQKLAPLLIVRDRRQARLIIADAYHRLGAVCSVDAEADVPCKIV